MNLKFVELMSLGDFDILVTNSLWVGTSALPDPDLSKFHLSNDVTAAEAYLMALGYNELKTFQFQIGNDL